MTLIYVGYYTFKGKSYTISSFRVWTKYEGSNCVWRVPNEFGDWSVEE